MAHLKTTLGCVFCLFVFFFKGAFAMGFLFKEDWFIAEWCLFFFQTLRSKSLPRRGLMVPIPSLE